MFQFRQLLLYWSQISFTKAFFLGLQTGSSRWEPNPENAVDREAIQTTIRAIFPLLRSTCDTVDCLGESLCLLHLGLFIHNFFLQMHQ